MAVNLTPGLEIPEPSDYSSCEDDDDAVNYFTDLHQPDKNQPKPGREIDKLLNNLVDSAWEVISEQDKIDKNAQAARQIPVLNATKEMKVLFYMNTLQLYSPIIFFCTYALVDLSKMLTLHPLFFGS